MQSPHGNAKKQLPTWQLKVDVIAGPDQERHPCQIDVNGMTHIGNAIVMITQKVGLAINWSEYSLWWPRRKRWLLNIDQTLDNCGVTSHDLLELVCVRQTLNLFLPDMQLFQMQIDFSSRVYDLTAEICSSLSIKHPEELSLFKVHNWHDKQHGHGHEKKPSKNVPNLDVPENSCISEDNPNRPNLPAVIFKKIEESAEGVAQLAKSPPTNPAHLPYLPCARKPADKTRFADCWLNSSRSLMEQGIRQHDMLMLRVKYFKFHDLDKQHDQVRINQIYEQLRLAILHDDQDLTMEEAVLFAAIAYQAETQRSIPQSDVADEVDLDDELNKLENELGNNVNNQMNITEEPFLQAQVKIGKKKEGMLASLQKSKQFFCKYQRFQMYAFDSKVEPRNLSGVQPIHSYDVKSCEVAQVSSGENNKYKLKLSIGSSNGMEEVHLGFSNSDDYAEWYTALTLAARGKTMADSTYREEVKSMKEILRYRNPGNTGGGGGDEYDNRGGGGGGKGGAVDSEAASRLNPELYVSHRFIKKAKKELPGLILQAQSKVAGMSLVESKKQFIEKYLSLNDHGVAFFSVQVKRHNKAEKSVLGVAPDRLIQYDHKGTEVVQTYRYTNLVKWTVNWHTSQLLIEVSGEEIFLLTHDCPISTLHEYLGGYQFLRTRTSGQTELDSQMFYELTGGLDAEEITTIG